MAELGRSRVVAAGDRAGPRQARRVPGVRPPGPPAPPALAHSSGGKTATALPLGLARRGSRTQRFLALSLPSNEPRNKVKPESRACRGLRLDFLRTCPLPLPHQSCLNVACGQHSHGHVKNLSQQHRV